MVSPTETGLAPAVRSGRRVQNLLLGVYRRIDRHAGPQLVSELAAGATSLNRDALDDLCEVAGGVVGRQQSELLPAGRRDAVDTAPEGHTRERVDLDDRRLAVPGRTSVSCVSL